MGGGGENRGENRGAISPFPPLVFPRFFFFLREFFSRALLAERLEQANPVDPHWFVVVVLPSQVFLIHIKGMLF